MSIAVKERGVSFNGDMVRAILDDRKTNSRRPLKLNKSHSELDPDCRPLWPTWECEYGDCHPYESPFGKPGDRIWVRESWATDKVYDSTPPIQIDAAASVKWLADNAKRVNGPENWGKKRVSIHMPRWASRITLEVKRVWVERIQDISPEDIWKEGITHDPEKYGSIVHTFEDLWNSIYGTWDENPWAYCCEFEKLDRQENGL